MPLVIDLPPETETRLIDNAKARGLAPASYVGRLIEGWVSAGVKPPLTPAALHAVGWPPAAPYPSHASALFALTNPPRPGVAVRADIDALGLSVIEAAAGLGVHRVRIYNLMQGKIRLAPDMALRLEKHIGGTAEGWLALQAAYDLAQARKRVS